MKSKSASEIPYTVFCMGILVPIMRKKILKARSGSRMARQYGTLPGGAGPAGKDAVDAGRFFLADGQRGGVPASGCGRRGGRIVDGSPDGGLNGP